MSVTITSFQAVIVPGPGAYLAKVQDGQLFIWPEGMGRGPMIVMTTDDWSRIAREVMLAFSRAAKDE